MAAKVRLILTEKKEVRGNKHLPGAVLFEGECSKGFTPADVDKAIQMKYLRVDLETIDAEEKEKKAKKPGQNQQ